MLIDAIFAVILLMICILVLVHAAEGRVHPPLRVKRLRPGAKLPKRGNDRAAGIDLFAFEGAVLQPGETRMIPTGIACEIPEGYVGIVRPRSSAFRKGLVAQGTIDSDYRGDVFVVMTNVGRAPVVIETGTSVTQLVILPYADFPVEEVEMLSPTERGAKGFGSTGNTGTVGQTFDAARSCDRQL